MLRSLMLSSAIAAALAGQAFAEEAVVGVEEVVVTAQKRAENVQDVPISVTAFSGQTLKDAGIQDVRDLRRITPSLYLATSSNTSNTRIMLRGIGTSGNTAVEPSVAAFVDGVYVPRIGSLLTALNDIGSVEVLRGPQGTLFGRNASMGALLIRTRDPGKSYGVEMTGLLGNYDRQRFGFNADLPISDKVGVRISGLAYKGDGFDRNDLSGKRLGRGDGASARVALRWEIAPNLTWNLKGDYQNVSGDGYNTVTVVSRSVTPATLANWTTRLDPDGPTGPQVGVPPYTADTYSRHVRQNTEGDLIDFQTGLASEFAYELANGFQLKLISGYRDWHNVQYQENNGQVALPLQERTTNADSQNHSEEVQILSPETLAGGHFSFVAGGYYYEEAYDLGQNISLSPQYCSVFLRNTSTAARVAQCNAAPLRNASTWWFSQDTESTAAYAQATWKFNDKFDVTGGIRYSKDKKDAIFKAITRNTAATQAPEVTLMHLSDSQITYRVNGSYHLSDSVMFFASFATGFKSGGFDSAPGAGTAVGAANRTFLPETTEDYELGVKSELFERRLIVNANLFRTRIDDLQFRTFDGLQFRTRNNGKVRQQGLEFDTIARPIPPLTLTLSGTYLDSTYLEFKGAPGLPGFGGSQDLTGERLPYSPKWQGSASAQYVGDLGGGLTFMIRADGSYTAAQLLASAGDNNPDTRQGGYTTLAGRIAIRGPEQKWSVALVGTNLTNKAFCTGIFNQPNNAAFGLNNAVTGGTALRCTLNEPRQVGLELNARF